MVIFLSKSLGLLQSKLFFLSICIILESKIIRANKKNWLKKLIKKNKK